MDRPRTFLEIFRVFFRLGLTSFGGPIAHLGYFRQEFVVRRKWVQEAAYADLVALCQFLPGPASSQVGMAIGLAQGGLPGALAAWLGFTLPSAVMLVVFGVWFTSPGNGFQISWVNGLKIFAVAVVAQAVLGMAKNLCQDNPRRVIALAAAVGVFLYPGIGGQILVMVLGGIAGALFLRSSPAESDCDRYLSINKNTSAACLVLFFLLLFVLPAFGTISNHYTLKLFDGFYRAGALVFGGGHVVLPLLQSQVVTNGWVNNDVFLAGYGAAQMVPGPLFTFAAYLGAVSVFSPSGWLGAAVALVAIFLPAFLLIVGTLPYWQELRRSVSMMRIMPGVNAGVVGILLAAWYDPVITSAVHGWMDVCWAAIAYALLVFVRWPYWLVAIVTVLASVVFLN